MANWKVPTDQGVVRVEANSPEEAAQKATAGDILGFVEGGPTPDVSKTESAVRGAAQGGTIGFGDELFGGLAAAGMTDPRAQSMLAEQGIPMGAPDQLGAEYEQVRDDVRQANDLARKANPKTYGAAEIAGGIAVPGVGALGSARGLNALAKTPGAVGQLAARLGPGGRVAAAGAGVGAAAGAGYSNADTLGGLAGDTALGAGLGTVMAPLAGLGVRAFNSTGRGVQQILEDTLLSNPQHVAERRLRTLLGNEGYSTAGATREGVAQLGPEGQLADLLPYETEMIAQSPGGGSALVRNAAEARQTGVKATEGQPGRMSQQERLREAAAEELRPVWDDYGKFMDDIALARSTQAKPLYEAAHATDFNPSKRTLDDIFNTDIGRKAQAKAKTLMELDGFRELAPDPHGLPGDQFSSMRNTKYADYLTRALRDMQDEAYRGGSGTLSKGIGAMRNRINTELYDQVPQLKEARGVWSGAARMTEAAEQGRKLMKGTTLYDMDVQTLMRDMSPTEQDSLRIGLMRGIIDRIELAGTSHNAVTRIAGSTRIRKILKEAFGSEEAAESFLRTVDNETVMNNTYALTRGGSRTARTLAQRGQDVGMDPSMGYAVASGNPIAMGAGIVRTIASNMKKDLTPEQSEAVAQMLFSDISEEQLEAIFRRRTREAIQAPSDSTAKLLIGGSAASAAPESIEYMMTGEND